MVPRSDRPRSRRITTERCEDAGLTIPPTPVHREAGEPRDLAAAVTRPGDVLVVPIHDRAIRNDAISVYESGRSVLAVSQNPEASSGPVASQLNLAVGRSFAT